MRNAVILALIIGLGGAGWHALTRRSVAVPLGSSGYQLAFTVDWGLGMDQRFTLKRRWVPLFGSSSNWIKIFDKPYNSGATLYVSDDGKTYYVSTGQNLLIVVPGEGELTATCFDNALPDPTALAKSLSQSDRQAEEQLDPGAPRRYQYVREENSDGELPEPPPPSRYYEGVRYIGRFGVTGPARNSGRGTGVGFAAVTLAPEPQMGLGFSCG